MVSSSLSSPWSPPSAPEPGQELVSALDPRVDREHAAGVLPCPSNPPPPDGWQYWKGPLPTGGAQFATTLLHDSTAYPIGCFVQTRLGGRLIGARVEWHDLQGRTGKKGCFRGVNLMAPINGGGSSSEMIA